MRQHLSTHPFRGVDNVYVDAEPKHSENPKPKGNGGGPVGDEPATQPDQPPPDNPDISPDIPSAPPAETQSPTEAWADKAPDIAVASTIAN